MDMNAVMKADNKYLSKEDVTVAGVDAMIARVTIEEVGDDSKPVIHFMGGSLKPAVCNKTNAATLISLFGPESDNWSGKAITVYHDPSVAYAGKIVGGIRFMVARSGASAVQPQIGFVAQNAIGAVTAASYAAEQAATDASLRGGGTHQQFPNDDIPF